MNTGLQQCLIYGKSIYLIYKSGFPSVVNFLFCRPIIRIDIGNVGLVKCWYVETLYLFKLNFQFDTVTILCLLSGYC